MLGWRCQPGWVTTPHPKTGRWRIQTPLDSALDSLLNNRRLLALFRRAHLWLYVVPSLLLFVEFSQWHSSLTFLCFVSSEVGQTEEGLKVRLPGFKCQPLPPADP